MTADFLSTKPIPPRERLIVALDMPNAAEAKALVERLGDGAWFYKLGLELFMAGGYFELMEWLAARGKKVFADLKFFDIPQTVGSAVRNLAKRNAYFATVHGYDPVIEAALANKGGMRILAVTVLTSFDDKDLANAGYRADVRTTVLARAKSALARGCDGVVCSGLEAEAIRRELGPDLLLVTPGIRPFENRPSDDGRTQRVRLTSAQGPDDQKRAVDVEDAFRYGADYIVVGRPIRAAADPAVAAAEIQRRIAALFAGAPAR
jgi:orotidine-5'-phosphate decarboxylase